jgi:hypothetical protein
MPSRLRQQQSFDPISAGTVHSELRQPEPKKQKKMSLSQTYFIASSARTKLGREASKPDHNLRLLVGHANLLDSLMLELQDAEREQERWFHETVAKAQHSKPRRHIQWADTIVEDEDQDDNASDTSDSDSEFDEEDFEVTVPSRGIKLAPVEISSQEIDVDEEEDGYFDDMEDEPELALTRTHSHQPPELVDDSDSDDESPPHSPPQPMFEMTFDEKNSALSESEQAAFFENGYFIPERNAPLIAVSA